MWNWVPDAIIMRDANQPFLYNFCASVPISRLLTVGSTPVEAFSVIVQLHRMDRFAALIHNEWGIIEDLEFDCPTNCPGHRIDDTPGRGPAYLRRASRHRNHQLGSHKPKLTFYTQYFHLWEDFINTWEVTFRSHPTHTTIAAAQWLGLC